MHYRSPSATWRRLPSRSLRHRLTVIGLTLAISAAFWAALWFAHRDPDPRLFERLVPVTIVPTPPADDTVPSALPAEHRSAASGVSGQP